MVEGGIRPHRRVVAQFTRGRETGRRMGRIVRARIVLLVARVAECVVQRVIVIDVAIGTLPRRNGMRSGQRESSGGMIKLAVRPEHSVVTLLARRGEACVRHRSRRRVVVALMATHASRAGDVVVVVDVAIGALARRRSMATSQREAGAVVIEGRIQPGTRVVALIASLREIGRHVIRIRSSLKIFKMATDARRAIQRVVVVHMAIRTLPRRNSMQAG